MANGKNNGASGASTEELSAAMALPPGFVLVRKVRGPDGQHSIGWVAKGHIYTMSLAAAAVYCGGESAEFELVFSVDRAAIDAASKEAQSSAAAIAKKEQELAAMKAGK
ncbi:MAG: hypothetical protein KF841_14165 [Phycisphaerae bacterium]|nr:hypothetical protein [Phycisphaerae bacterium]